MMPQLFSKIDPISASQLELMEDSLDLWSGLNSGHMGKYIYSAHNWNEITECSDNYYIPKADADLVDMAACELTKLLPSGIDYVDFGVGGTAAIKRHALPIIQQISANRYIGVDYNQDLLDQALNLVTESINTKIEIIKTDFFNFELPPISNHPALGVMNGLTLTNHYGTLFDREIARNLVPTLKYLAYLCGQGWLMVAIDCNNSEQSLKQAYITPLNSQLYLRVFHRMADELSIDGFDAAAFTYAPEWHADKQLFAHMAQATKDQRFSLGGYQFHITAGQKFHLLNSYKYQREWFEQACTQANLSIIKRWDHETPMKLYLLRSETK